jgi:uncharacterized membrane protein
MATNSLAGGLSDLGLILTLTEFHKTVGRPEHSCIRATLKAAAVGACMLAVLSQASAASSHAITFAAPQSFGAQEYSAFATACDLNGDGELDLVVYGVEGISVLLGNGDATFQPPIHTQLPGLPGLVGVGDFNGDGRLDLAVPMLLALGSGSPFALACAVVLLGNGDGTFAPPVSYPAGNFCSALAVGDFNNDGNLDLAVASIPNLIGTAHKGQVSLLLGNGDGTFRSARSYSVGTNPSYVVASDLNRDGKLDLVVANDSGGVSILLGDGGGEFSAQTNLVSGGRPASIAVGDFDGDGRPDLAVANFNTATVSVFLGRGDGTFRSAVNYPAGVNNCYSVVASDFNGDGRLDLAVADYSGGMVQVLEGKQNGTFNPPVVFSLPQNGEWLAVGDFDHDGRPDLAVSNPSGSVFVMQNTTRGKIRKEKHSAKEQD